MANALWSTRAQLTPGSSRYRLSCGLFDSHYAGNDRRIRPARTSAPFGPGCGGRLEPSILSAISSEQGWGLAAESASAHDSPLPPRHKVHRSASGILPSELHPSPYRLFAYPATTADPKRADPKRDP